eukprot:8805820-Pyramimonas_sp.AAC.1
MFRPSEPGSLRAHLVGRDETPSSCWTRCAPGSEKNVFAESSSPKNVLGQMSWTGSTGQP